MQAFPLILILFISSFQAENFGWVDGAARLIKVPLNQATTQGAGSFGQPVVSYYTPVSIGTPSKTFKVQFDLDTNELFVPHYSWNPFNRNMHYSDGFQCKVSTTCHKTNTEFTFEHQNVKLTGKRYEDMISLNVVSFNASSQSQLPAPAAAILSTATPTAGGIVSADNSTTSQAPFWQQNFLAISSASDGRFSSLPIDGFFGLGPAEQSQSGVKSLLISLHAANFIDNLQFSLWFNPVLDSPQGGELILGGVEPTLYKGQIYWHHMSSLNSNKWALGLQSVSLGNQVVSCSATRSGCQARFSSGLSDILGPREDVLKIYSLLNTTKSSSGLQLIDCRRIAGLPYMTFYMDGIPYYLLPSNYIRKTVDGSIFKKETCYVAILPSSDDSSTWTLATPFLGAYYSIYDLTYRQIGFAALR